MYSAVVLDHFEHPRHSGTLEGATVVVHVENPVCGDMLELSVRLDGDKIAEVRFRTRGCVTAIACSSLLTEMMIGKSREELRAVTPESISAALGGLPPATFHSAQLACDAVAALLLQLP